MSVIFFEPEKPAEHGIRHYAKYLYTGAEGSPDWLGNWVAFATEFRRKFGEPLDAETTFRKLHNLRQLGSARDYAVGRPNKRIGSLQDHPFQTISQTRSLKVGVKTGLAGRRFSSLKEVIDIAVV